MILPSASPSTWLLALVTAAAYAIGAAVASRSQASRSHLAMAPAWALHAGAIGWSQLGGAPHFGFAAALSMTAWLVLTIYALERESGVLLWQQELGCEFSAGPAISAGILAQAGRDGKVYCFRARS